VEGQPPRPVGVVHLKDLLYKDTPWPEPVDLRAIARKTYLTGPEVPLEDLLTELRKRRVHLALVQDGQGQLWSASSPWRIFWSNWWAPSKTSSSATPPCA
jgi:CBS domain containing-hemolysin-like protein